MLGRISGAFVAIALVMAAPSALAKDGWFGSARKGDASVY